MVKTARKVTVAKYLQQQIDMSDKSQKEIAEACGWERPNMVTMVKQGASKLPINKVAPMAKVLGIDPVYLLRLVMSEYMPETWEAIEQTMASQPVIGQADIDLLKFVRKHTRSTTLDLGEPKHQKILGEALEKAAGKIEDETATEVRRVASR